MKQRLFEHLPQVFEGITKGKAELAESNVPSKRSRQADESPKVSRLTQASNSNNSSGMGNQVPPSLMKGNNPPARSNQPTPPPPPATAAPARSNGNGKSFIPWKDVPQQDRYDTPRSDSDKVYIRNVPYTLREAREKQHICAACNIKGHTAAECRKRFQLFKNGELFFFPAHHDPYHRA
jgi:hypothetical protein